MKRISIFLIVLCVILASCTSGKPVTPIPTAAKVAGISLTPSAEDIPVNPEESSSGAVIPRLAPGTPITIQAIQMFDPLRGWAVGSVKDSDDHVLATYDSGQTWQDVTPSQPQSSEGHSLRAQAYFTSPELGWVTYYPDDYVAEFSLIWYTKDGGKSWQSTSPEISDIDGDFQLETIYFFDNENGWLVFSGSPGAGQAPAIIYHTSDGGKKWALISSPSSEDNGTIGRCCRTGLDFLDANTGLITSSVGPDPVPAVNWTLNGGSSWEAQQIPPADEKLFANAQCGTFSPNSLSDQSVLLVVDCVEFIGMEQKHSPFLYFTTDLGKNWQWVAMPLAQIADGEWESVDREYQTYFHDAKTGWIFVQDRYFHKNTTKNQLMSQMFQTTDGGQTWTKVNTMIWIGHYSFVNPETGWAVAVSGPTQMLVKTTDGGKKWLSLYPTISQ